jgi:hypothetical protein
LDQMSLKTNIYFSYLFDIGHIENPTLMTLWVWKANTSAGVLFLAYPDIIVNFASQKADY